MPNLQALRPEVELKTRDELSLLDWKEKLSSYVPYAPSFHNSNPVRAKGRQLLLRPSACRFSNFYATTQFMASQLSKIRRGGSASMVPSLVKQSHGNGNDGCAESGNGGYE